MVGRGFYGNYLVMIMPYQVLSVFEHWLLVEDSMGIFW